MHMPRSARRSFWLLFALLCLGGVWARSADFRTVFTRAAVELLPADSHYYVRFARLQQASFPRYTSFDPYVNHPEGASILWPPLHALGLAAWLAPFDPAAHERQAATFGLGLALLELAAVMLLARRVAGERAALVLGAILALTPAVVEVGALGTADHHVHEPSLVAAIALVFGQALRTGDRRWGLASGLLLGGARLLTPASFFLLPLAGAGAVLAALRWRADAAKVGEVTAAAAVGATAVLVLSAVLLGEPLSLRYEALSSFHALLAVGTLALASAIALLAARRRKGVPLALGGSVALALVTPESLRALAHLGRGDPLLQVVVESGSLIGDPAWALRLLGPVAILVVVAIFLGLGMLRRRATRERGVVVIPAVLAALALVGMGALQARFTPALAGACAALLAVLTPPVWSRAWKLGAAVALIGFLPALWPQEGTAAPADVRLVRPTLRWMREHLPVASPEAYGPQQPAWAVLANHQLGHFINLWAERPAIASTFSQRPVHQDANARAAAVLASTSDDGAHALARDTGARYVLVTPIDVLLGQPGFDRPRSTLTHLLEHGGMETPDRPATSHFRWVFDSVEQRERAGGGSYARLFEVVPGASLQGAASPRAAVVASTEVTVGTQRVPYRLRAHADPTGAFSVVVAYPGTYRVEADGRTWTVSVEEEQVSTGAQVELTDAHGQN